MLLLLTFGAYIPPGYMPAAGTPFLLELCPAAAPLPEPMAMDMGMAMDMSMPMDMPMDMSVPMHMAKAAHPRAPDDANQRGTHPHAHFENCPFGSAPAAGPLSQGIAFTPPAPVPAAFALLPEPSRIASRLPRAHPPRGPPSPA